tara:strand:- start:1591 stop:1797 length:207 start_codon:yes stop_codon:yes gene_type:complete
MDSLIFKLFAFTSNSDVSDGIVFGLNIETWLIYTLVLFGLSSLIYLFVWIIGNFREKRSGRSIKQPWE